jgi:hypothetical protein
MKYYQVRTRLQAVGPKHTSLEKAQEWARTHVVGWFSIDSYMSEKPGVSHIVWGVSK